MAKLRARGTAVYLVTGGVRALVAPVARELDLPLENVFSNVLTFSSDGEAAVTGNGGSAIRRLLVAAVEIDAWCFLPHVQ